MSRGVPRRTGDDQLPRAPFELIDELSCYYDTPAEPNSVHIEAQVTGSLDYRALREAVAGALAATPRARGRMMAGRSFRCRYAWEFPPVPDVDPVSRTTWSDERDLAAARGRFLASTPPLRTSPPVRLLLASGPGTDLVILNAHHAALDGLSCLELLRDIAARYADITGEQVPGRGSGVAPPRIAPASPALSRPIPGPPPGSASRRRARGLAPAILRRRVARIAPERPRRERRDGYGVVLLPVPAMRKPAGATVNDLLVAALIATITRWNAAHHRRPRAVKITVPLNARPQSPRVAAGNHSRLATVTVGPATAAGHLSALLAEVTRQTNALRRARPQQASAGALGLAPSWCPVGVKRLAVRFALRTIGRVVCDTCMLTNLGNVTDPPWSGCHSPVRLTLSGPAHMPRGVSVGAATADGQLQLAFRYRYALLDESAAKRFAAEYADVLDQFGAATIPRAKVNTDGEGGDTSGPAGRAAQDPRLPGRQGLSHVLRRRGPAVQPAPEARVPD